MQAWQVKKMFENLDFNDPEQAQQLQQSLPLFCGAPGTGKTTLARVIAKKYGYNPIEINASDERNTSALLKRIQDITETTRLQEKSKGPSLLIIDEIDGFMEQVEDGSSAMGPIIDFIYGKNKKGKKNNENKY